MGLFNSITKEDKEDNENNALEERIVKLESDINKYKTTLNLVNLSVSDVERCKHCMYCKDIINEDDSLYVRPTPCFPKLIKLSVNDFNKNANFRINILGNIDLPCLNLVESITNYIKSVIGFDSKYKFISCNECKYNSFKMRLCKKCLSKNMYNYSDILLINYFDLKFNEITPIETIEYEQKVILNIIFPCGNDNYIYNKVFEVGNY